MAEQAYIDENNEGGRYNDGESEIRYSGGGGTGGGGTGGSTKTTVSIISGCMDKSATNYNPRATSSKNSTCRYPTKTTTPLSESRTISVTVKSNDGGTVMIDGTDTLKAVTTGFNYTGKELLTPKFFKVRKSG